GGVDERLGRVARRGRGAGMTMAAGRAHLARLEVQVLLALRVHDGAAAGRGEDGPLLEPAHVARLLGRHHPAIGYLLRSGLIHVVPPRVMTPSPCPLPLGGEGSEPPPWRGMNIFILLHEIPLPLGGS